MANVLADLRVAHDNTHLTQHERVTLAPYFYKFLHAPCKSLGIPVDYVVQVFPRFVKYLDSAGSYKGCVFGLLHSQGAATIAKKLYYDRNIIILRISPNTTIRLGLIESLNQLARLYFYSIDGVEGSVSPIPITGKFEEWQVISFQPTERGEAYVKARQSAIATAMQSSLVSLSHLTTKVKSAVSLLIKRYEVFPEGKAMSNETGT